MASREVPHATAVTLDSIEERSTGLHVAATIHVEKAGQRSILVGRGGEKIRDIGTAARQRLSELVEGLPADLPAAYRGARSESGASFGDVGNEGCCLPTDDRPADGADRSDHQLDDAGRTAERQDHQRQPP